MKRWICLLLLLSMMCCISACGKENYEDEPITGIKYSEADQSATPSADESADGEGLESGAPYDGIFPEHEPYGTGVGAMPGRVVWTHNHDSVEWDGNGYWWETDNFDEAAIRQMADESIASLGGK